MPGIVLKAWNKGDVSTALLASFCSFIERMQQNEPAAANMQARKLLEVILVEKRFDKGEFFLIFEDDKPIGCSGIYESDFSPHIVLAGVRSWLIPEVRSRSLMRNYVLNVQRTWAIQNNYKQIALSFNEYNKNLRQFWARRVRAEHKEKGSDQIFYRNKTLLDYPVLIKHTPQWVIYEKLDDTFEFDWSSLRC